MRPTLLHVGEQVGDRVRRALAFAQLHRGGRARARADGPRLLEPRGLQRGLGEAPVVHLGELLLRVLVLGIDLEDDLDGADGLDQLTFVGVRAPRELELGDGLLRLLEAPVGVAQLEPVLHFLGLGLDELLEDLGGLLELALLQELRDGVLELSRVDTSCGHWESF